MGFFWLFKNNDLNIRGYIMLRDFLKWVLLLSLFSSGVLKLINPAFFLPYFSELPITSEFSAYFSVLFFSAFQIFIVIMALIPK